MIETIKIDNLSAKENIYFSEGIIYSYSDNFFYKYILDTKELEKLEFAQNSVIYKFRADIFAYMHENSLKVKKLKKNIDLVDFLFHKNIIINSIALSPSGLHTIIGTEDGKVNLIHNIVADIFLKFPFFTNEGSVEFVDYLDENIILGATKKSILLVNILEKGVLAKITPKDIIRKLITSSRYIIYSSSANDIFLTDVKNLDKITTKKLITIDTQIVDICFNLDNNSIYILCNDKLLNVDFEAKKIEFDLNFNDAKSISIIDNNSVIIGFSNSSLIVKQLYFEDKKLDSKILNENELGVEKKKDTFHFLTVDDSATMRLVIKKSITNNFKNVIIGEANNGLEAMEYLQKHPDVDVMLLDWNMPKMNGGEVVEAMSKIKDYSKIKIVMATTEGGKEKVKQMLSKGVKGYLVKPFRPTSVIPLIEKMIEIITKEREK